MKILLVNHRFFISGGPERYMFNIMEGLTRRGHEVIPFSIRYSRNHPTPYAHYFVNPLGRENEITFKEQTLRPATLWRTFSRLFYAPDVEKAVGRLIRETRPQVAYILHYLRKLSPSLLVGLKKANLPIVVRLSDYGMICPQAHCLRDGSSCELCIHGNLWPSVHHRCVQGSFFISFLNALATWFHRFKHYFDLIDVFVTTNRFMQKMMLSAGFSEDRLKHIPTFTDFNRFKPISKENYIVYAGRIEFIKGIHVLIEALVQLRKRRPDLTLKLKIAGSGDSQYYKMLIKKVADLGLQDVVQFLGELDTDKLSILLGKSYLSSVPSLWYENLPNAILESYACGTPVLASNIGSLAESVKDGETGYLFKPGDPESLSERLEYCLDHPHHVSKMAHKARYLIETIYSPEKHLINLEGLFNELIQKGKKA